MSAVPADLELVAVSRAGDITLSGRPQSRGLTAGELSPTLAEQLDKLRAVAAQLDAELRQAVGRRAGMRVDREAAEAERRRLISERRPVEYGGLAEVSQRSLTVRAQLAGIDAHASGLRERLAGVKAQLAALEELRDSIEPALGDGMSSRRAARMTALDQTTRQLYGLVDAELDALDAELHAGPIQRLSDVVLEAEILGRELARGERSSAAALRQRVLLATSMLDEYIERVRPAFTTATAPARALRVLAKSFQNRGLRVAVTVTGRGRPLPRTLVAAVQRIAEAALDNARRHAGVDRASVVLALTGDRLTLVIRDDGDGFDVAATEARLGRSRCLGLLTMHERAVLHDGRLEIRSETGVGTEVRLSLPLPAAASQG
ncbi:MAG: sensor histidine kinase [Candidatus Dormibacteria bacterium]